MLFLGVDAGGTKTDAWLGRCSVGRLELIGKGRAGPANLTVTGLEAAGQQIKQAIEQAFSTASLQVVPISSVCLCLAGCGRSGERQIVQQWALDQGLAKNVMVSSDAEILLAATQPIESRQMVTQGIGLIAGTGSIAWGQAAEGQTMRCGGWGPLLGDEGSGYAIGLAALKAACTIADGRVVDPILLTTILSSIDCDTADEIVPWTYAPQRNRAEIASLAPSVFAISSDSRIAQRIIHQGAEQLAQQVATLASRLRLSDYPLAIAGGLLIHQAGYRQLVKQQLHRLACPPSEMVVVAEPVRGAFHLAAANHPDTP